jgi:S1-C subfamily serine protease
MKNNMLKLGVIHVLSAILMLAFGQTVSAQSKTDSPFDSVVTIYKVANGTETAVGSGVIVDANGYILTALHLVRYENNLRIKLLNGEVFDNAKMVNSDERRNVAVLKISATDLKVIPNKSPEEVEIGNVSIISNASGSILRSNDGTSAGLQLADTISGAGKGYRVLSFDTRTTENIVGGLLLNENGQVIGIVTTKSSSKNIAVPISAVLGLIQPTQTTQTVENKTIISYGYVRNDQRPALEQVPQTTVENPYRPVYNLDAAGPGSAGLDKSSPKEILKTAKTVYVDSDTSFFKSEQLVNELMKRKEVKTWGWTFVSDRKLADLIIDIDHEIFTYKFTFKMSSQRQGIIITTGGVIILDGNLGSDKMANDVIKRVNAVINTAEKPAT